MNQLTEENRTCVNRVLGFCPNCERDYNLEHHPNNLDCPRYKEMHVMKIYEPKTRGDEE